VSIRICLTFVSNFRKSPIGPESTPPANVRRRHLAVEVSSRDASGVPLHPSAASNDKGIEPVEQLAGDGTCDRAEYEQSFQKIFDAYRTHRVVMRCIVEQSTQDSVIGAQFQEMMAVFVAAIEQHIVQGQRVGVITDSRSPKNLAVWLTWMLEFGQMKLIGPADERTVRKYTAAVTDIVWKTLYADASSHG